ncbi:MAG: protease complex subunit PrcB family protein [Candidatus Hermodarchaeota archaeon]
MRGSFKIIGGFIVLFLTLTTSIFILVAFEPLKELGLYSPLTEDSTISFETISQGWYCGISTRNNYTITELEAWEKLWMDLHSGHTPLPELPSIDFTTELLFAVFQGERPTGGYMTNITRISVTETSYEVYIDEIHPGAHCVTTQALTQPYHIVKISNYPQNLPVQFIYNIVIDNCDS